MSHTQAEVVVFAGTGDYLGHAIQPGRLERSKYKTDSVAELEHYTMQM